MKDLSFYSTDQSWKFSSNSSLVMMFCRAVQATNDIDVNLVETIFSKFSGLLVAVMLERRQSIRVCKYLW